MLFRNKGENVSKIIITSQSCLLMFALRIKLGSNDKIFFAGERKKVSTHGNLCLQNISSEVNENQVALKDKKLLFSLTVICLFLFVPTIVFNFFL